MTNREPIADFTTLEETEDEFSTRDRTGDQAVANARSREDRGWRIWRVEAVAGLCIGDTGAAHSLGSWRGSCQLVSPGIKVLRG